MMSKVRYNCSVVLLLLLSGQHSLVESQGCGDCTPGRAKTGVQGGYTAVLSSDFNADHLLQARSGSNYWVAAMADRLSPPSIEVVASGSGQIQIIVDPTLPSTTGAEDRTDGLGRGVIAFNPRFLSNPGAMTHFFGHEFGHAFGFADNYNCDAAGTKMVGSVSSDGPFTGDSPTCGDMAGVARDYRRDESPVIVDLDGGGIRLSSSEDGVCFQFGASLRRVAWPTSPTNAFLVLDRNGNGIVDDAGELFGNWTYLFSGVLANNGYEALAEYDEDGNGWLDSRDPIVTSLMLWRDSNRDGISASDELVPLTGENITGIGVQPHETRKKDRWGNEFRFQAPVLPRREYHKSYDVFLRSEACR